MKGDFLRYLGEYTKIPENKEFYDKSEKAYNEAIEMAAMNPMMKSHLPLRISLSLNFSLLYYI